MEDHLKRLPEKRPHRPMCPSSGNILNCNFVQRKPVREEKKRCIFEGRK